MIKKQNCRVCDDEFFCKNNNLTCAWLSDIIDDFIKNNKS